MKKRIKDIILKVKQEIKHVNKANVIMGKGSL